MSETIDRGILGILNIYTGVYGLDCLTDNDFILVFCSQWQAGKRGVYFKGGIGETGWAAC